MHDLQLLAWIIAALAGGLLSLFLLGALLALWCANRDLGRRLAEAEAELQAMESYLGPNIAILKVHRHG